MDVVKEDIRAVGESEEDAKIRNGWREHRKYDADVNLSGFVHKGLLHPEN